MSSPTANIGWGISLPEGWQPSWKLDAEEVGLDDPASDECLAYVLGGKGNPPPGKLYGTKEDRSEYRKVWRKVWSYYGLTFVRYGSYDVRCYMLVMKGSIVSSTPHSPLIIRPAHFHIPDIYQTLLDDALEKLELSRQKGEWLMYGFNP